MEFDNVLDVFLDARKILIVGKGSSIDSIDLSAIPVDFAVININDSETIIAGQIGIVSNPYVKDIFIHENVEFGCDLYISDRDIAPGRTWVIKSTDGVSDNDLFLSRFLSDEILFEESALFTALHLLSACSRKIKRTFEVYLIGFDFENPMNVSSSSNFFGPRENPAFNQTILSGQKHLLELLLKHQDSLGLCVQHIGDLELSWMNPKTFSVFLNNFVSSLNMSDVANRGVRERSKLMVGSQRRPKGRVESDRVIVVAEITTNHFGDKFRLFAMIEAAAQAGADYIKLQRRDVENFYSEEQLDSPFVSPFGEYFRDYRLALELDDETFWEVDAFCRELGIGWFASVLDYCSFQSMLKFNPAILKIPSTISEYREFITQVSREFHGDIVVSTGYTDKNYEKFLVSTFPRANRLFLLQCTSAYPCPDDDAHIGVIRHYYQLKERYSNIIPGYSSHDVGSLCSQMAIAAGARMIEKHVKFGSVGWGHFDEVAIDLADGSFIQFVEDLRRAERIFGSTEKSIKESEHHKYWPIVRE